MCCGMGATVSLLIGTSRSILVAHPIVYFMSYNSSLDTFLALSTHPKPPKLFFPVERSPSTCTYVPWVRDVVVVFWVFGGSAVVRAEQSILCLCMFCSYSRHLRLLWNSLLHSASAFLAVFLSVCTAFWETAVRSITLLGEPDKATARLLELDGSNWPFLPFSRAMAEKGFFFVTVSIFWMFVRGLLRFTVRPMTILLSAICFAPKIYGPVSTCYGVRMKLLSSQGLRCCSCTSGSNFHTCGRPLEYARRRKRREKKRKGGKERKGRREGGRRGRRKDFV